MKKKLVIELMVYIVIVVIGIIILFVYEPEDVDIVLQKIFILSRREV